MSDSDLNPGNPLRVACRTCTAAAGVHCISTGLHVVGLTQDPNNPRFHKKRVQDAFRDWKKYGTERTKQAVVRGIARRPRPGRHHAEMKIGSLLDSPQNERAISEASRGAKDMQTPEFWTAVWEDE